MALGVDPIPGLEWVTLVAVKPDGMFHLMRLLLSIRVDIYSTRRRLFAYLGDLTSEGIPPVVDIPYEAFVELRPHRVVTVRMSLDVLFYLKLA